MAPGPGPLHGAAIQIGKVGTVFYELHDTTKKWPWPFGILSGPFYDGYEFCYRMADRLYNADQRFEAWDIHDIWDNPTPWVLMKLGAHPFWAYYYQHNPWGWITQQIHTRLPFLRRLETDPAWWFREKLIDTFPGLYSFFLTPGGWIKDTLRAWYPGLYYLFDEPDMWVLQMLGVPWWERWTWKGHLLAWLLHRGGLSYGDALAFESDPFGVIQYIVNRRWPFLNDIYYDPRGWLWYSFEDAVETYMEARIEWVIRTGERIILTIWDYPLP